MNAPVKMKPHPFTLWTFAIALRRTFNPACPDIPSSVVQEGGWEPGAFIPISDKVMELYPMSRRSS